jgi:hypothetical protein
MNVPARAISEFVEDYERAAKDLVHGVSALFPEQYIEIFPGDEDEVDSKGRRIVEASAIENRPDDAMSGAFENFNWQIKRALKRRKNGVGIEYRIRSGGTADEGRDLRDLIAVKEAEIADLRRRLVEKDAEIVRLQVELLVAAAPPPVPPPNKKANRKTAKSGVAS